MVTHLLALVPGQRLPDEPRQLLSGADDCLFDLERAVPRGQVKEHDKAGRTFDQSANRGPAVLAHQQVALPVARYGPVCDLGARSPCAAACVELARYADAPPIHGATHLVPERRSTGRWLRVTPTSPGCRGTVGAALLRSAED